MEDYRFIEIEEEFEDDDEEEEEEEEDYDEEEFEENLIPEGILEPTHSNFIFIAGEEDDDEEEDYEEEEEDDDFDQEDEEDYEEEEMIPVARMLPRGLIEDEDYEDEDEDDEYYEEEQVEELIPVEMTSPRVSISIFHGRPLQGAVVINEDDSNDSELCEGNPGNQGGEIDGLSCPICFEAWTSGGGHQICCLPCGHLYGFSCIKKWLQQRRSSGKCPQCNSLCTLKDVRVLYTTRLCVADEELQKKVQSLEAKCADLEQKAAPLTPEELIDKICSNPTLVQRLVTALAELQQQQEDQQQHEQRTLHSHWPSTPHIGHEKHRIRDMSL